MSTHTYDEYGESHWYGVYAGKVVDNVDPDKRGRVTVLIPGLCEPATNWALPAGGAQSSGAAGLGAFDVPPKGASVFVMFLCGDIDEPIYFGGWRKLPKGKTDAPSLVAEATASDAANKLKVYETEKFSIVIDERSGSTALSLRSKKSDVRIEVREDKILLGKGATEKIVKGSTFWQKMDLRLTSIEAALAALAAASQGPFAAFQPGFQAAQQAETQLQQGGAGEAYLSELSFTE